MFVVMMIYSIWYLRISIIVFMIRRCIIRYGGVTETLVFGVCSKAAKAHGRVM